MNLAKGRRNISSLSWQWAVTSGQWLTNNFIKNNELSFDFEWQFFLLGDFRQIVGFDEFFGFDDFFGFAAMVQIERYNYSKEAPNRN